jgi:hypothetical protein
MGGMRIEPEIELGVGRDIARAERSASHEDEPLDLGGDVRCHRKCGRDVGHGTQYRDGDRSGRAPHLIDDEVDGMLHLERHPRLGEVGAPQTIRPVKDGGPLSRCVEQGSATAREHLEVSSVCDLADPPGIFLRLGERNVARDSGDPQDFDSRRRKRQEQGDGVVDTRVTIDDDALVHLSLSVCA